MKHKFSAKMPKIKHNIGYTINNEEYIINSKDLLLIDSLILPESNPTANHLEEKKLIYNVFSIQYTVFSALMTRSSFYPGV
jgi:hypothetical protein